MSEMIGSTHARSVIDAHVHLHPDAATFLLDIMEVIGLDRVVSMGILERLGIPFQEGMRAFRRVLGEHLADRWTSSCLLGGVLVLAGLASLGLLAVNVLEPLTSMEGIAGENLPLIVGLVIFGLTLCFLPCLILGTVSPIVAKLAVRDPSRTGRTVGQVYAALVITHISLPPQI